LSITCIVPARNEAGHLADVIGQVMLVSQISKIFIIEGGSSDHTQVEAARLADASGGLIELLIQTGTGKFNAVLEGAAKCSTEFILIWDADGTVSLADTQKIVDVALQHGVGVIGNRLKGTMEKGAMQYANYFANWAFAILWAPYTNRKPIDLLCGTKIFPREVFMNLPHKVRDVDPYGDFTLVASAVINKIEIISIPVDYSKRRYGVTNIKRWRGGIQLLRTYSRFVREYEKI
jgi:glycosyltransferase involved in cell wall biosynthesis